MTRSKGTLAGSRPRVRCRASAHGAHALPTELNRAPPRLFLPAVSKVLLKCSHVFDLQPNSYATDKSRIAYVMNLLRSRAAQWGTALWEGESHILDTYASFVKELKKVFNHPVQGSVAASRLFQYARVFSRLPSMPLSVAFSQLRAAGTSRCSSAYLGVGFLRDFRMS